MLWVELYTQLANTYILFLNFCNFFFIGLAIAETIIASNLNISVHPGKTKAHS